MKRALSIRHSVFWPAYGAFFLIGCLSLVGGSRFIAVLEHLKETIFNSLDWLYAYGTLGMVIICLLVYVSPLAHVRIGGDKATPLLNKKQWFAISLCTTVTAGIMFWATSEPLVHMMAPPASLGIEAGTPQAEQFALATLFHHWSITSYAIYTIPGLAFALAIYNLAQPFSLAAIFSPMLGSTTNRFASLIDGMCVFTLVAGLAASLGTGALTMSGAFAGHLPTAAQPFMLAIFIVLLVVSFTASALSGLLKGIRLLSSINVWLFFLMLALIFFLGPTEHIVKSIIEAFRYFVRNFIAMSTFTTSTTGDPWPNQWPIFYWSSWLSWAPITAVFLGRISYGHTVRDFIHINLFAPSLFSCIWVGIFGGSALYFQKLDGSLYEVLQRLGPNAVSYELLNKLPSSLLLITLFVIVSFVSYTTAADSTTDAIGALCTKQHATDQHGQGLGSLKITWAITVGFVAFITVFLSGIDGMKLLCGLGGLPALFLVIGATLSLLKMVLIDLRRVSYAQPDSLLKNSNA